MNDKPLPPAIETPSTDESPDTPHRWHFRIDSDVPLDAPDSFVPFPFLTMGHLDSFMLPTDGTTKGERTVIRIVTRSIKEISARADVNLRSIAAPDQTFANQIRIWRNLKTSWPANAEVELRGFGWGGGPRVPSTPDLLSLGKIPPGRSVEVSGDAEGRPDLVPVFARMKVGQSFRITPPDKLRSDPVALRTWRASLRSGENLAHAVMRLKSYDGEDNRESRLWRVA